MITNSHKLLVIIYFQLNNWQKTKLLSLIGQQERYVYAYSFLQLQSVLQHYIIEGCFKSARYLSNCKYNNNIFVDFPQIS